MDEPDEIGPNFNKNQFYGMVRRVVDASWRKRCKKISGDDNGNTKFIKAKKEAEDCLTNWVESEEITTIYSHAKLTGDNKPFIKK